VEMSMNQIRLYDLFRKELRLPDDKAAAFVKAVGDVVESEATGKNHLLLTKDDVYVLKGDIGVLKNDVHVLKGDIGVLKGDIHSLELKIEQSKTDIYKAMFLTGIVQLIAILGGTLAIVKLMK
jgi:hypothetical protein